MNKEIINRLIENYDNKQLQELIAYIVTANGLAEELLLDYCQRKESDVKTDTHTLIIESKIKQYWKSAARIIEEFDMYGGGPESDEDDAYGMLENMMKLLEDNEVSWIVRKEILDGMLGFVASDNSGFTDYLMDIAVIMCTNRQEKLYLAAYYKKHNDEETALKTVLEGLDKADGRLDEIYEYLFRYYEKNKNEAALERLYEKSEKRNRDQDTITELMSQYYQKKGDYAKQKETLIKLLSCCDSGELHKVYQKCRQELSGEYPREVVDMYWKEVAFYVSLGKEKNYVHAVSVLKEIRTIMKRNNWTDEWNGRYKTFLEEHRRKKLLLKELGSIKE